MDNNKTIRLTSDAELDGYKGEKQRIYDADGNETIYVISGPWYTAPAIDDEGNEYMVYWVILDDVDVDTDTDAGNHCDWSNPKMILDQDGHNIVGSVKIEI